MQLFPALKLDWLNGWILLAIEWVIQGSLMYLFPKSVVSRLLDRSQWSVKQKVFLITSKVFSLICLVLIVLTPLKTGSPLFIIGLIIYVIGIIGLVVAMFNFKDTPPDQPVTKGIYKISRHPQLVALFVFILGICLAIGSWIALIMLLTSKLLQHFTVLAEEEACLHQYGESYRLYMQQIPRYCIFF